jgi:hypothetical protein
MMKATSSRDRNGIADYEASSTHLSVYVRKGAGSPGPPSDRVRRAIGCDERSVAPSEHCDERTVAPNDRLRRANIARRSVAAQADYACMSRHLPHRPLTLDASHWRADGRPKVRYPTRQDAIVAAEERSRMWHAPLGVYECAFCRGWHMGRRGRSRQGEE